MKKIFIFLFVSIVAVYANVAKITAMSGDVTVNRDNKSLSAQVGFPLKKEDKVITGNNARAQIVFSDNTIISLGKNSNIAVEEYVFEVGKKPKATFKFGSGVFKSISGKISKLNPTKYKLKTKSASIGIRGTIIGLQLSKNEELYMVLDGKIEVTNGIKRTFLSKGRQMAFRNGVVERVRVLRKKDRAELERDSGARENERESGLGENTQSKAVSSSEKCNYR